MVKQISIFLENRKGQLAEITELLANADINLMALNIAEAADYGLLRLIVKETDKAQAVLKEAGYITQTADVVGVHVPDEPGGLARILKKLQDADVDISYMYSVFSLKEGQAYLIFKADDCEKAERIVKEN